MKVYAWWHGGLNYAVSGPDDTEEFPSLKAAGEALVYRELGGDSYYPCVSDSSMWIFSSDPREMRGDHYPDRILKVGPRGGVLVDHA